MAALRGARMLAYLLDMSRILRSGRLAIYLLATISSAFPQMLPPLLTAKDCYKDWLAFAVRRPTMTGMKKAWQVFLLLACLSCAASALAQDAPVRRYPPAPPPYPEVPHRPYAEMTLEQRERLQEWREERHRQRFEAWREMSIEERHQLRRDIREAGRFYRRGPR